ncbi:Na+/H+ antiporter subunit E [Sporosarcina sp. P21c]|uniref:Na+/H+ antiporter subunit E n=1 Tax=Sporosarcina TaxID=1569 RepID=UPI000A168BBD|nr:MULTISPECIES: Na+/H+ antiporter subunit E [Sporosarcina]ARJ38713.1 cation:proton antiporter [Sporosarcina ureae]PIC68451.1 Na+/H+ antiporter subunit E [Sporosarcina sp. P16a]PIC84277.1 Na+/H+ antiporter subunit E [Sporosarcina sp. P1]PIC88978.1 Na+/H+ antiporter subunit E [Sporosarcina sp. P21c]PIC92222.1 Na+/H+ antiporter subunit E [Sporosarcina sp. P25]
MPLQLLLNLFIAFLWMTLMDEDELRFTTFFMGFLVGLGIIFVMSRFFDTHFYLRRVYAACKLLLIFIRELTQSSIVVISQIMRPTLRIKPGIFKYKTILTSDVEVTMLSMLLTLTPGSVVMEVSSEGNELYIHAMDVEESRDGLIKQLKNFEKAIMEVTR